MGKNIYIIVLCTLIISQITGLYGGFAQLPRLVAIFFSPLLFINLDKIYVIDKSFIYYFTLSVISGIISIFFAIDNSVILKELVYVLVNFLIFIEIVVFCRKIGPKSTNILIYSFSSFILLTIPFALIEIIFNIHFSNAKLGEDAVIGGIGIAKRYASITFGNYNLYNHILILGLPFVLTSLKISKNRIYKLLVFLSFFAIIYITTVNGSRATFLAILIISLIFFQFFYFDSRRNFLLSTIITASFVIFCYFYFFSGDDFNYLLTRLESKGFEDKERADLISYGLEMLMDYNGFGVGPGNYSVYVDKYYRSRINTPHNFFIELVSQYGLIIFTVFINLLIVIYKGVFRKYNFILLLSLLSLPMALVVNSVYLGNPFLWIYFASLYVIAFYYNQKKYSI